MTDLNVDPLDNAGWAQLLILLDMQRTVVMEVPTLMGTRSTDLSNFTYSSSQKTEFSSYGDIRQGPNARYGFQNKNYLIE